MSADCGCGSVAFDGRHWHNLGERGNLLAGEGWRYCRNGRVRHQITDHEGGGRGGARCGLWTEWVGTGSQAEYERLASLPKCRRCEP
jgi:hypothetical protein